MIPAIFRGHMPEQGKGCLDKADLLTSFNHFLFGGDSGTGLRSALPSPQALASKRGMLGALGFHTHIMKCGEGESVSHAP